MPAACRFLMVLHIHDFVLQLLLPFDAGKLMWLWTAATVDRLCAVV